MKIHFPYKELYTIVVGDEHKGEIDQLIYLGLPQLCGEKLCSWNERVKPFILHKLITYRMIIILKDEAHFIGCFGLLKDIIIVLLIFLLISSAFGMKRLLKISSLHQRYYIFFKKNPALKYGQREVKFSKISQLAYYGIPW